MISDLGYEGLVETHLKTVISRLETDKNLPNPITAKEILDFFRKPCNYEQLLEVIRNAQEEVLAQGDAFLAQGIVPAKQKALIVISQLAQNTDRSALQSPDLDDEKREEIEARLAREANRKGNEPLIGYIRDVRDAVGDERGTHAAKVGDKKTKQKMVKL